MAPTLLIVGEGEPAERAAERARELGATFAQAPPALEDALEVARTAVPGAVVGVGSDEAVRVAAATAEAVGVPHPHDAQGALAGTDVAVARARLESAGIPQPPWAECASPDEAAAEAARLGFPALVRSLGEEYRATVEDEAAARGAAERAIGASHRPACLVERKRAGGCRRERRPDIDAALGCAAEAKVVDDEVVGVRAVAVLCTSEEAVADALGAGA
jgi:biotin carboxylase